MKISRRVNSMVTVAIAFVASVAVASVVATHTRTVLYRGVAS